MVIRALTAQQDGVAAREWTAKARALFPTDRRFQ